MNFDSKDQLLNELKKMKEIGSGSQGTCYLNKKTNEVYKIFNQYLDEYDDEEKIIYNEKELLRFSHIKNKTFIWSSNIIKINEEVVGYITSYVKAIPLFAINPLNINLDKFSEDIKNAYKDIKILSDNSVLTYDIMYNILYGNQFYLTDFDEFCYSNKSKTVLNKINNANFNYELYYFLIFNYFDEFIKKYHKLNKMYQSKDEDFLYFLKLFRQYLSEYLGYEILTLGDATKCLNKYEIDKIDYYRII